MLKVWIILRELQAGLLWKGGGSVADVKTDLIYGLDCSRRLPERGE